MLPVSTGVILVDRGGGPGLRAFKGLARLPKARSRCLPTGPLQPVDREHDPGARGQADSVQISNVSSQADRDGVECRAPTIGTPMNAGRFGERDRDEVPELRRCPSW